MTKDEILLFVYNSQNIKASAKRITKGDDLYNDLLSELLLIVSEIPFDVVNDLYAKKELEVYCYKIMYYQFNNPNLEFYRKYRSFETSVGIEYTEENIDEKYAEIKTIMDNIEKGIACKRYPAEVRLLEVYAEKGSFRATGREVGIACNTVKYMINNITEKIRKEYDSTNNS
jgi:hypothetical protein